MKVAKGRFASWCRQRGIDVSRWARHAPTHGRFPRWWFPHPKDVNLQQRTALREARAKIRREHPPQDWKYYRVARPYYFAKSEVCAGWRWLIPFMAMSVCYAITYRLVRAKHRAKVLLDGLCRVAREIDRRMYLAGCK